MLSRFPVERSSTTVTSNPLARRRSTTCEPMNPAPPVTRTLGNVGRISFLRIGARLVLQREQVARRVDNSEAPPIGGRRLQSHTRLVQELVHQGPREIFDGFGLLGRKRPHSPESCDKLRTPQSVHLLAKLPHDRYRRQARHPVPVLLDLSRDYLARGGHIFPPLLEIGGSRCAQVVEIVQEDVADLSDTCLHIARQRNVEYAERPVAARRERSANASYRDYGRGRSGRANQHVDVAQRFPALVVAHRRGPVASGEGLRALLGAIRHDW